MTEALFTEEAPPYVRPSLAEILDRPWNGLTAVSSFSGCGGSSLGMKMAGWRIPYAIEFVPAAAETYMANYPDSYVDTRDIREIDPEEILGRIGPVDYDGERQPLARGQLDCFEGSPPCASFSPAGMRERGWGTVKKYSDVEQATDDLFDEYVRLLHGLYPRSFIAENVPGMLNGAALDQYAKATVKLLQQSPGGGEPGYDVWVKVLNASNYGVPQDRRRLIFVGVRRDVGVSPYDFMPPPQTTPVSHTTRQALESVDPEDPDHAQWLAESSMEGKAVGRTWEMLKGLRRKDLCVRCEQPLDRHRYEERTVGSVKKTKDAETTRTKRVPVCEDGEDGTEIKEYFLLRIAKLDEPCPTLTATGSQVGAASVTHPTENRKFTPAEAKALCGFPADFVLTGEREQRYERMGRAVPPPFMAAVAGALRDALLEAEFGGRS